MELATEPDPDGPVVDRVRAGDRSAFRELIERHQRKVVGLVMRTLHCDRELAADLGQEVFLRVFRAVGSFDGQARFSTWLHTITLNLCITEYRKGRAQKRAGRTLSLDAPVGGEDLTLDPPAREPGPADRAHHAEIAAAVREAVAELPDEFKQAVLLRDLQGLAYEEIGEILGVPPGTVRSRIHRGRLILQDKLRELRP